MKTRYLPIACLGAALLWQSPVAAQSTPEEWVQLGAHVHGGFGTFIALGIRIGEDAMKQLGAQPRELDVTYYDGVATPCPCAADGIMIATHASPGQAVRYAIPDALRRKLAEWSGIGRTIRSGATGS